MTNSNLIQELVHNFITAGSDIQAYVICDRLNEWQAKYMGKDSIVKQSLKNAKDIEDPKIRQDVLRLANQILAFHEESIKILTLVKELEHVYNRQNLSSS